MLKIFTQNENSPELIEPQIASFKKYLQEDFEFILFNAEGIGKAPDKAKEITRICKSLSVPVIEVTRDKDIEALHEKYRYDGPATFNAEGRLNWIRYGHIGNYMMNWSWQNVIAKETGPICSVHSDVFLMEPIKLTDYLKDNAVAAIINKFNNGLEQIWEPILLMDLSKNLYPQEMLWNPAVVEGEWRDTGGLTYYYMKNHPEITIFRIGQSNVEDDPNLDFHPSRYQFFYLGDKKVFHYLSGSKWLTEEKGDSVWKFTASQSNEYHAKKLAWAKKFIGV